MSAKHLEVLGTWWTVEFAYLGKTAKHWREMLMVEGAERDAWREAEQLYCRPEETAVGFNVFPLEDGR